jgi:hypothetical protein
MERMTYNNLTTRLLESVPEFSPDAEDIRDNLQYPVFSDLTRFIISTLETTDNKELLRRIFNFIEEAAKTQDKQILDLLKDSFNELAIKEPVKAKPYMGRFTRRIFQAVEGEIYGDPSAVRKIGRSLKQLWGR